MSGFWWRVPMPAMLDCLSVKSMTTLGGHESGILFLFPGARGRVTVTGYMYPHIPSALTRYLRTAVLRASWQPWLVSASR